MCLFWLLHMIKRFWLLASGFWLLASGFWLLASGFWLLASGFWLLASGFWLLASGFWLLASGFWLLASGFFYWFLRAPPAPGPPSSGDPAKTFLPSGSVIFPAFTVFVPSLARQPSTETMSPVFNASFRQPCRYRELGAPASQA